MGPNDNRRLGVVSQNGGDYEVSANGGNVVFLQKSFNPSAVTFDQMTVDLVIAQFRQGVLQESALLAILTAAGLRQ